MDGGQITDVYKRQDRHLAVTFGTNREDLGGSGSYISRKVEELVFGIVDCY